MTKTSVENPQSTMALVSHIKELGGRLVISAAVLLIAGILTYVFYDPILNILRSPLGAPLYYNNPAGSFDFIIRTCFMGGIIITIPVITYNLIRFIQPAFKQVISNKKIFFVAIASFLLAVAGGVFAFKLILPGTLQFFAGFQSENIKALISADSYLKFVINIIVTFVLIFQLPLLIIFIDSIKPLKPNKLIKFEKWVILGSLIVALIAPFTYDLVTSILIALPIIALYNLSILAVLIKHSYSKRQNTKTVIMPAPEKSTNTTNRVKQNYFITEITPHKKVFMDIVTSNANQKQFTPKKNLPKIKTVKKFDNSHIGLISDIRPFST